jgi:flavin-binding protein dodecin
MTHTAKVLEVIGNSDKSWQDAALTALDEAKKKVHGITGTGITDITAKVDSNTTGNITEYHSYQSYQSSIWRRTLNTIIT